MSARVSVLAFVFVLLWTRPKSVSVQRIHIFYITKHHCQSQAIKTSDSTHTTQLARLLQLKHTLQHMHMVWEQKKKKWWRKYSRNNNNNSHQHHHLCGIYIYVERRRKSAIERQKERERASERMSGRDRKRGTTFSVCTTFCVRWWRFQYTIEEKKTFCIFNQMRSE